MPNRMGWEEVAETPEFKRLTAKQKMFVVTYIENGYDPIHATRTAYLCKSDKNAHIMSYALLRNFHVIMCLAYHFGDDPEKTFLDSLARDIHKGTIDDNLLKAYLLYAEVKGWKKSAVVRAYELAKEMGYGPAQRKKGDPGISNLKTNIKNAEKQAAKDKANPEFDLSGFEDKLPEL